VKPYVTWIDFPQSSPEFLYKVQPKPGVKSMATQSDSTHAWQQEEASLLATSLPLYLTLARRSWLPDDERPVMRFFGAHLAACVVVADAVAV
jgi:hypothetical protein